MFVPPKAALFEVGGRGGRGRVNASYLVVFVFLLLSFCARVIVRGQTAPSTKGMAPAVGVTYYFLSGFAASYSVPCFLCFVA